MWGAVMEKMLRERVNTAVEGYKKKKNGGSRGYLPLPRRSATGCLVSKKIFTTVPSIQWLTINNMTHTLGIYISYCN